MHARIGAFSALALLVAGILGASLSVMTAGAPRDMEPHVASVDVRGAFYAGCGEQATAEPSTIPLWCSSSDQRLENLSWASWGGARSLATGVLTDNPCDCASGEVSSYPVAVSFSGPERVGPVERYRNLSVTFAADRPAWATRPTMHFLWGDLGFLSDQERP